MAEEEYWEYYDEEVEEETVMNGSPHPPSQPPRPHVPQPPHATYIPPAQDTESDDAKELGTSDDYIDKQLIVVMDSLGIQQHARPAIFKLPKQAKLTMIQQFHHKEGGKPHAVLSNVTRQNQPKPTGPNIAAPLIPLGKHISAPVLLNDSLSTPTNTISLQEAQNKLQRSKTPNNLGVSTHFKSASTQLSKMRSVPDLNPKHAAHAKSKSQASTPTMVPPTPPIAATKNGKLGLPMVSVYPLKPSKSAPVVPPPVPAAIKQKYMNKTGTESNRSSSVKSSGSNTSDDEVKTNLNGLTEADGDEEYEYYDDEEYEDFAEEEKPDSPKPPTPKPKLRNVKVKLKIGSEVQVFSKSKQRWTDGSIVKIKGKLLCVAYGPQRSTQKWLEATSKNFRPKLPGLGMPAPAASSTSKPPSPSAKLDVEYDHRVRQSVAFQQPKQVKIKLRIGSTVEVYSVSKNRWTDGRITGIKKDLIRVAYGPNLATEKWLRATSKQFRPKLDMVDAAITKQKTTKKTHKPGAPSLYEIDEDEQSKLGTFIPDLPPNLVVPDAAPTAESGSGAYLTHSLRREQYVAQSVGTIKGSSTKRGDLKIKVHGALQLKSSANFTAIKVAEHTLKTKKVASDENPVWKEIVTFSNFRPHLGKTGTIQVINKSAIMGEKIIGSAEFELPIVFGRQEKMTIDIADSKNKLSGIIILEQVVVESGR